MKRIGWLVTGMLGCALTGCHLFPLLGGTEADKAEKDRLPIAGVPSKHFKRVSQFCFYSDFELRKDHPFFKEISNHREHVYRELRLPPSNTDVFVYVFENKETYDQFLQRQHPQLPERRAFFVAQAMRRGKSEDLMVYTYWSDAIQKDLRHELTHAMLHSVLKGVPLWLDEGLAEYFELPVSQNGVNPKHVENLRHAGAKPDLDRLEKLEEVHQMTPAEYRESWAWVHLMLRSTPQAKQALLSYLQELRANPNPGPLRPRLATAFLSLENAWQNHLTELDRRLPRNVTAQK